MGGKPIGQWQQICICLALLIIISGCGLFQDSLRRRELREAVTHGQELLAHGDFEGSLNAFQNVIAIAKDQPPADAANFHIGVVYAHPQNPRQDRQKALGSFQRVLTQYPESLFTQPAKAWVGVLNEIVATKQEIERTKLEAEKSKQEIEKSRLAAERFKQDAEKSRTELERSRQEFEKAKQLIEKSKQVDIQIEKKRRERGR
jgi:tetratricopeptide (TPR) repeat protein